MKAKKSKPYKVVTGDVLEWARSYAGPKFHALLCDPPYNIAFMGKSWDNSGIVFSPKTWKLLKRHLHPGAFCFAFSSTRTLHRMMVAIEDAGFVIHPFMALWNFANGMPKATNPSYALDKMQGAERKLLHSFSREGRSGGILGKKKKIVRNVTESATVGGQQWQGHRYGLQALKPAFEPVVCFQKPYPKKTKPVLSMLGTGAGALNIDGCRIGYESGGSLATNPSLRNTINGGNGGHVLAREERRRVVVPNQDGRWPSNLILSHLPECRCIGKDVINKDKKCNRDRSNEPSRKTTKNNIGFGIKPGQRRGGEEVVAKWECAEGCPVRELDKQTSTGNTSNSRYYLQAGWAYESEERIAGAVPLRYVAKPSKREKDAGLNTPVKVADAYAAHRGRRSEKSSTRVDGGKLALARNTHPTPKPLALAEYLAKLLKCPKGYRSRLLVPFSGSGSEMIGGMLAGWHRVVGIEREKEYATIAKQRLRYWRSRKLDAKQAEGVVIGNQKP